MSVKDIVEDLKAHDLCVDGPSPVDAICSAVRRACDAGVDGLSAPALQTLDLAAEAVVTHGWFGLMDRASGLRDALAPLITDDGGAQ